MLGLLGQWNRGLLAPDTDFQARSARADREVTIAEPADEVERLPRLLLARQAQCVGCDRRLDGLADRICGAEKAIRRRHAIQCLMRTLEVVVLHEMRGPALAVVEVREDGA
jgi:hypothetical protein